MARPENAPPRAMLPMETQHEHLGMNAPEGIGEVVAEGCTVNHPVGARLRSRAKALGLVVGSYVLMVFAGVSTDGEIVDPETVCFITVFGLILVAILVALPARASWVFFLAFGAVALYQWWPQTVLWRLQHAEALTTQDERDHAELYATLDALVTALRDQQLAYAREKALAR